LNKMDKKDKADVEEIITVLGLYFFRLIMKAYQKMTTPKEEKQKKAEYIQRLDAMNGARVRTSRDFPTPVEINREAFMRKETGIVQEGIVNPLIASLPPDMGEF